ncbi:ABC transporter permease [Paenibacillus sp. 32O-W]|jgi:ABC-type sugar transport systems, permease components|uniref:Spermidine/putrescine ABC transporter permease n=1 Tax=Paenibacillus cisolokensis TaxID=1658519 RepID=A0ABQ4N9N7_9BACL|nr:ABC transporter permease [Paenibacillus sp. 32O-W]GIQ64959.1 spermidine/putrescine ABC transporter permease [Paenibacillus cisolokensis]
MAWPRSKRLTRTQREAIDCYVFISPAVLGLLLFMLGPIVFSAYISFTDYDILSTPEWVGLQNYAELFRDPFFWLSLKITFIYAIVSVPLGLIVALLLAMLLNQSLKGIYLFRVIYYLPAVISGVAVALLWKWIFNPEFGLLNWFLGLFGIKGPMWIFSEDWALPSIIIMSLWSVGGSMLIYLAGLQGIPTELYEAAEIDGANRFRRFLNVTLPMLSPVIFFNLVMGIIGSLQVFTEGYVMTQGGPNNSTLFSVLYLYRQAFNYFSMGYASAMAWVLFLIILALTLLVFRSSPMWVFYEEQKVGKKSKPRGNAA